MTGPSRTRTPAWLPAALAAIALLPCAACLLPARPAAPEALDWLEVSTPHFTLRAATSEDAARAAMLKLERVRDGLLASTWHSTREPLGRVEVILLPDRAALRNRYQFPPALQGAAFAGTAGQLRLVASADQDPETVRVFKHELAHAVSRGFLLREPLWLSEGLACYLETLELTGARVVAGGANLERLADAGRLALPFAEVMTTGPELYAQRDELPQIAFYGRAWLLFHLLVNRHRVGLELYFQRLARAEDPAAAFAAAFPGLTPALLDEEAKGYVRGGAFEVVEQPLPARAAAPEELRLRRLRPAEVLLAEAQLWQVSAQLRPRYAPEALAAAQAALAADPTDPSAIETWAELALPDAPERAAAARKAVQGRPGDVRGWLLLAEALGQVQSSGPERERVVEEAVRLAPNDGRAQLSLALLRLVQERIPEALAAAQAANGQRPGRAGPLDALATALAASGECAAAVQAETRVLEVLPERSPPQLAGQVRARIKDLGERCEELVRARAAPVEPRRISCAAPIPRVLPPNGQKRATIKMQLRLRADGGLAGVTAEQGTPAPIAQALEAFLRTCKYQPATRGGAPVASQLDEVFTFWAR
jgi:tetratricopeptide (TPR) repeat protein